MKSRMRTEKEIQLNHDKWELSLPFVSIRRRNKLLKRIKELEKELGLA